jgi:hypothetical protein
MPAARASLYMEKLYIRDRSDNLSANDEVVIEVDWMERRRLRRNRFPGTGHWTMKREDERTGILLWAGQILEDQSRTVTVSVLEKDSGLVKVGQIRAFIENVGGTLRYDVSEGESTRFSECIKQRRWRKYVMTGASAEYWFYLKPEKFMTPRCPR